jgi:23S rRNA pseudouridine1911/1915/1917 synthase
MAQGPSDDQPRRNDGAFHRFVKAPKSPIVHSTKDNLQVLYEDNHIVAVNKRSGDVVQGSGTGEASLCEVVAEYVAHKYNKPGKAYIGTVHRLDRPVSGVILYARTSKAHKRLSTMFRHREMQKTYWAVVKPNPPAEEGHVINYLEKNEKLNKSFAHAKPSDNRKECELMYEVRGKSDHYAFVEVLPKTGRHHQIRATMAQLGCPIKGDVKYGARRAERDKSICLHARNLRFEHPTTKETIAITAETPESFKPFER